MYIHLATNVIIIFFPLASVFHYNRTSPITSSKRHTQMFNTAQFCGRTWYVLSCLWDGAYKRTLAANRKE